MCSFNNKNVEQNQMLFKKSPQYNTVSCEFPMFQVGQLVHELELFVQFLLGGKQRVCIYI